MTRIYIIRHAEAEGNYYRRIHGQYDSKITVRGYKQIDALAARFKDIHLDALYSSDLFRTRATAEAILRHHSLPLITSPRLREISMGVWEDEPWGNVEYAEPMQMLAFSQDPELWSVPEGEPYVNVQRRIMDMLTELGEKHDGQTIAVVAHGMIIRSFLAYVAGIPSSRTSEIPHGDNTCVAMAEYENGRFEVRYYNDNSHLSDEISTFANQVWWKNHKQLDEANLRFEPMDIGADARLFVDSYAEAWKEAHGSLEDFVSLPYIREAEEVSALYPRSALMKVFSGLRFAGIVELDPSRFAGDGLGWISFCFIQQNMRRSGFGVQLIGHAVSVYRKIGRTALALHVAETNENAIGFYEHIGFKRSGTVKGVSGRLLVMKMDI